MKRHDQLIAYIRQHRGGSKEDAEVWAKDNFGSDWRTRKPAKAKRIKLKPSNEKEWPDE
jgi:hypothetical protein